MNKTEAEAKLKPCKKCGSKLLISYQGCGFYRATCSNTECWALSKKYNSFDELVDRVNKRN